MEKVKLNKALQKEETKSCSERQAQAFVQSILPEEKEPFSGDKLPWEVFSWPLNQTQNTLLLKDSPETLYI